jgi:hypothetical protein
LHCLDFEWAFYTSVRTDKNRLLTVKARSRSVSYTTAAKTFEENILYLNFAQVNPYKSSKTEWACTYKPSSLNC